VGFAAFVSGAVVMLVFLSLGASVPRNVSPTASSTRRPPPSTRANLLREIAECLAALGYPKQDGAPASALRGEIPDQPEQLTRTVRFRQIGGGSRLPRLLLVASECE